MRSQEHVHRTCSQLTHGKSSKEADKFADEIGVETALRLFDGEHVDRGLLMLQGKERQSQQRAIRDFPRLVPRIWIPPVLEDETMHALIGRLRENVGKNRNEAAEFGCKLALDG